jgi:hypothetical protein
MKTRSLGSRIRSSLASTWERMTAWSKRGSTQTLTMAAKAASSHHHSS